MYFFVIKDHFLNQILTSSKSDRTSLSGVPVFPQYSPLSCRNQRTSGLFFSLRHRPPPGGESRTRDESSTYLTCSGIDHNARNFFFFMKTMTIRKSLTKTELLQSKSHPFYTETIGRGVWKTKKNEYSAVHVLRDEPILDEASFRYHN